MKNYIFGIMVFSLLLSSCELLNPCGSSKADFLTNYELLIADAKALQGTTAASDWKTNDDKFAGMIEGCYDKYAAEMTAGEEVTFWTDALTYYYYRHGSDMLTFLQDKNDVVSQKILENSNRVLDDPNILLRKMLGEDRVNGFKDLFKGMEKDLEKWGDKVEKILEK
jgi:hypothetical protein